MPFIILHLSDAHLGNPRQELDASFVLEALQHELRTMHRSVGTPDLVIFSGDLVYGELPSREIDAQFDLAKAWIRDVSQAVGLEAATAPWCFAPGNHDVNRTLAGNDQTDWIRKASEDVVYDTMQQKGILWRRIRERLQQWYGFTSQHTFLDYDPDLLCGTRVISTSWGSVGIASFNTSWSSSGDGEKGKLWLGKYQFQHALAKLRAASVKLAITHHPMSWLTEFEAELQHHIEANFSFHFHGHEHIAWVSASPRSVRIEAGACYSRSDKLPAYSWTIIDVERAEFETHLRTYSAKGPGGWTALIVPGETDDHGVAKHPLPAAFPRASTVNTEPSTKTAARARPADLYALLSSLQGEFYFRWEQTHPPTANSNLYWPVRLRRPSPIHAVQAFAAAALARFGARVFLYVDDLGNQEFSYETLINQLTGWFQKVGGDSDAALRIRQFSKVLDTVQDASEASWRMVERWLGRTHYDLEQVMRISKLWPSDGEILKRRPRRLLSPPLVWAAMLTLHSEIGNGHRLTTLGGYDERGLWNAWRELAGEPTVCNGHLYVPELLVREGPGASAPVHMARTPLDWSSTDDVRDALIQDVANDSTDAFQSPNRMFRWCLNGCVRLPEYVTGITELSEMPASADEQEQLAALPSLVARWLF